MKLYDEFCFTKTMNDKKRSHSQDMLEKWVIWVYHNFFYFCNKTSRIGIVNVFSCTIHIQTAVQWSKFETPHQLTHILTIDNLNIFHKY